jgi:tRNA1Val (adenine37-N6)-methyltransferase
VANTYFQFKQFIVHQEHTAMKVCTDACLFGAWVANDPELKNAKSIIDIGTGTGLLSLMLAQATEKNIVTANITAVEIEPNAAAEAASNFKASEWQERIHLVNDSIQNFAQRNLLTKEDPFDCVISNPPFFEGDLHSPDHEKNLASHSTALPWPELVQQVSQLLKQDSIYYVLIPALRAYTMQKLAAQNGLQLVEEVVVFNAAKQKPFRVFQKFTKSTNAVSEIKRSNFIIKDAENQYTADFKQLLAPYYLHL